MRVSSATCPSSSGTFRSARTSTRLPATSASRTERGQPHSGAAAAPEASPRSSRSGRRAGSCSPTRCRTSRRPSPSSRSPSSARCRRCTSTASGRCRWRRAGRRRTGGTSPSGPPAACGRRRSPRRVVTSCDSRTTRSVTEPVGTGARTEMPSSLPLRSGSTRPIALAAPVEVGIRLIAAARARRRSLCGRSRICWSFVYAWIVVMKPCSIPNASWSTFASGADAVRRAGGVRDDVVLRRVVRRRR